MGLSLVCKIPKFISSRLNEAYGSAFVTNSSGTRILKTNLMNILDISLCIQ